jgi:hypothetical protein
MIELRKRTWQERLRRLWPPYRRQSDAALAMAIKQLVDDPTLPCVIEGRIIVSSFVSLDLDKTNNTGSL